jgi:NADH-quinone oxidoreductase subunit L
MGLLAVFFTGFYTFRMVGLTFHGEPRSETAAEPEPVGLNVKLPLGVLGVLATVTGFLNMVPVKKVTDAKIDYLHQWLDGPEELSALTVHHYAELLETQAGYASGAIGGSEVTTVLVSAALSLGLAIAGAVAGFRLYATDPVEYTERLGGLRDLLAANYYQDEYQVWLAESVAVPLSRAADRFDQGVVDGVVNGTSSVSLFSGRRIRRLQTGVVTNYAALLTLGLVALLVIAGVAGGWLP